MFLKRHHRSEGSYSPGILTPALVAQESFLFPKTQATLLMWGNFTAKEAGNKFDISSTLGII